MINEEGSWILLEVRGIIKTTNCAVRLYSIGVWRKRVNEVVVITISK